MNPKKSRNYLGEKSTRLLLVLTQFSSGISLHCISICLQQDSIAKNCYKTCEKTNKTGTSKVGAISKAQKAQNIFLEKLFWNVSFEKCRTVPKKKPKGGTLLVPSGSLGYLEKVKNERGNL